MAVKKKVASPKITFFILAYNSEPYIAATIRSILNQTEKNIQLVIRNNGSTDGTAGICQKFAAKDKRIIYLENKVNMVSDDGIRYPKRGFWPEFKGEYISMVDSDDMLDPEFAAAMLMAAKKHHADIVVSGTTMFDDATGKAVSQRIPPKLAVNDMQKLAGYFADLYGSLRPIWGKIFRRDFFETYYDYAWGIPDWMHNGMDTFTVLGYLEKCQSLVSIPRSLHYYRLRQGSVFFAQKVDTIRIQAGAELYNRGQECIKQLQIDTPRNIAFLGNVYWGHMVDLMNILKNAQQMDKMEKWTFLEKILQEELTVELLYNRPNFDAVLTELAHTAQVFSEEEKYERSFLYRLLYANDKRENPCESLAFSIFLSALCDPENAAFFGMPLLQKKWAGISLNEKHFQKLSFEQQITLLKQPEKLKEYLLNLTDRQMLDDWKEHLMHAMTEGNFDEAITALNEITVRFPLDREGLYFRIYLSYQIGDKEFARIMAEVAKLFWPDDEDIQIIYSDVML